MKDTRPHWGSSIGFILAAAGSAVGLGNLWKFPYITGQNGGGAFVLIYLGCILFVGLPIMLAEVFLGKSTQSSVVGSYRVHTSQRSPWKLNGLIGVAAAFLMLSFYSVVAGWALHYLWQALSGGLLDSTPQELTAAFGTHTKNGIANIGWHAVFMLMTTIICWRGISKGVERANRILMPSLFILLTGLLIYSSQLSGFEQALDFVFGFQVDSLSSQGALEALGHSFFTLSLGMGAMITYGSYLRTKDDIVRASVAITILDTAVALMACLVLFPITFTYGMEPTGGPGLVFINIPIALSHVSGGAVLAVLFFVLVAFAALSSSISLLEIVVSYFIDERKWPRGKAVASMGLLIFLVGIPSALSKSTTLFSGWFHTIDQLVTHWMLPIGGMVTAGFVAWRVGQPALETAFAGSAMPHGSRLFALWILVLRYLVPLTIGAVLLHFMGFI